jgi:hypothetical protein
MPRGGWTWLWLIADAADDFTISQRANGSLLVEMRWSLSVTASPADPAARQPDAVMSPPPRFDAPPTAPGRAPNLDAEMDESA